MENASLSSFLQSLPKDHLHLRGEHHKRWWIWTIAVGSPPLTWRTQIIVILFEKFVRITSTYVENTGGNIFKDEWVQDHLHLRGEHSFLELSVGTRVGSPPLTWRTPLVCNCLFLAARITSTYVENTRFEWWCNAKKWDHLHLRGEHYSATRGQFCHQGSPPLTWRTPSATSSISL